MIQLGILTDHHFIRGAGNFYYPLVKWKRQFAQHGIKFYFSKTHQDKRLFKQDIVIIDHRYYRNLIVLEGEYPDKTFIIEVIKKLKEQAIKVVLFDNKDGTGSKEFDLIHYVDLFVKKQVLRDREEYTKNKGVYSYMPFTEGYDLSERVKKSNEAHKKDYDPCPPDMLYKIKVGWNIGMCDYRYFPLKRFYPGGTNYLLNTIYKTPFFNSDFTRKTIGSTFRGTINKKNENYSFQRNKVIELFKKPNKTTFKTGSGISKRNYLNELKDTKTCVSLFGWGEICYRDFEAILCGALLVKPDMSHMTTFPNVYKENETYVPFKWNMSDLESTLEEILGNYEYYIPMIKKSQRVYYEAITDSEKFIYHFKNSLELDG